MQLKKKKIRILGGNQKLNFIFVDDVVKILEKSLDSSATSKQTFNLGSKNTLSIEEYVIKIKEILDFPIIVERYPMRKTETINFHPSLSKLNKFFGNMHKTSIDDGIKNTIEWYSK